MVLLIILPTIGPIQLVHAPCVRLLKRHLLMIEGCPAHITTYIGLSLVHVFRTIWNRCIWVFNVKSHKVPIFDALI